MTPTVITIDEHRLFRTEAITQAAQAEGFWQDDANPYFVALDGHQVEVTALENDGWCSIIAVNETYEGAEHDFWTSLQHVVQADPTLSLTP